MAAVNESQPLLKDPSGDELFSDDDSSQTTPVSFNVRTSPAPDREGGTSNFETMMHIIKGNLGTGILAMPLAISNAGILVGTVGLLLLGIICVHCMHLLVHCSHVLCARFDRPFMDYADVAEAAFEASNERLARYSKIARKTVNVFLFITQIGFCCVYTLFIAQNLRYVVETLVGETDANFPLSTLLFELFLLVPLIPFVFIKDIKRLAPFSFLANIATFIGLGFILYYIWVDQHLNSVSRLPLFTSWSQLPLYFGAAIYAFEGIGVVLPVENAMSEPKALPSLFGVLNVAMTIVCVLYITVGFYGYIQFGEGSEGSITLNIESWYGVVVQILFSIAIFVSYAIQFYVPMTFIGPSLASSRLAAKIGPKVLDGLVRVALVLFAFGVAAVCGDSLGLLISLIGSLASSALALIFPPLLEVITFWPERHNGKCFWPMFVKDMILASFGMICFIFGTVFSCIELAEKLR